jgi:demethylmenaquinone methyltransferase/2-methoxy-6-polyprenyl-1,4-benzoquinol methylase
LADADAAGPTIGGVSRSATPLPAAEDKVEVVRSMFDRIAPRYDLVNRLLTFRMDIGWRRRTVNLLGLPPGALVLDLACGTGDLCRDLAAAGHRPVGLDLSLGMLRHARTTAPLAQADALRLPVPDGVIDGVTCGFALRNLRALEPFIEECARVLRPGGRLALLEVSAPRNRFLRAGHRVYFGKVVPWVGARLSDAAAYRYLPESVVYLPAPEALCALLRAGGFTAVEQRQLSTGIAQLLTATRREPDGTAR